MPDEVQVSNLKVSSYELIRQQKIEENKQLLIELGLTPGDLLPTKEIIAQPTRKKPRFSPKLIHPSQQGESSRSSRRLKGEAPEDITELELILDQSDRARRVAIANDYNDETERIPVARLEVPDDVYAPLTLLSIGTTIWDLGTLYTDQGRSKFWSGRGCRYKHPYPIGFRATKSHFGNNYTMCINQGSDGPEFTVQVNSSNTIFKGPTPTAPWTEACKRSKSQGTRVSGPLFYGFSDPITMKLIENMEGYEESSQPED